MAYPEPGPQVHEQHAYGILIWPTYTDTSVTVTLYSTQWVIGDQTGQTPRARPGSAPRSRTDRAPAPTADGHTEQRHRVRACYQPAEGSAAC